MILYINIKESLTNRLWHDKKSLTVSVMKTLVENAQRKIMFAGLLNMRTCVGRIINAVSLLFIRNHKLEEEKGKRRKVCRVG